MAHGETVGIGKCDRCGSPRHGIAVKVNRSGLAYYRCDECGFEGRDHWAKSSDRYLRQFAAPPEGDIEGEKRGDSPPPEKKKSGGLGSLFGG